MTEIWTDDIFKASYLLNKCQRLHSVKLQNGKKYYAIKGEYVHMHDLRYQTGRALINPLILRATYHYLEQVGEKDNRLLSQLSHLLHEEYGDFPATEDQIAI
jgi:hypothetical protein